MAPVFFRHFRVKRKVFIEITQKLCFYVEETLTFVQFIYIFHFRVFPAACRIKDYDFEMGEDKCPRN